VGAPEDVLSRPGEFPEGFRCKRLSAVAVAMFTLMALTVVAVKASMSVLDDYLVDPEISLLDKTCIRAQPVPVPRALRAELGKGGRPKSDRAQDWPFIPFGIRHIP
jgi:hypothetical protein